MNSAKLSSFVVSALLAVTPVVRAAVPGTVSTFAWDRELNSSLRLPDRTLDQSRVPAQVTVITADEIRASGARTLQELLAGQAMVNQFDTIGNSFSGSFELRGFNASPGPGVSVVVDGVRVNEAGLGQVNAQLIPLETIERVEITPGPNTLYGRNALAGVIHITTKRGGSAPAQAETGASFGSFGRRKGFASARGSSGGVDYFVSGSKEVDSGYRNHSDADIGALTAKLGYKREELDISAGYTRVDDRLQQPGSLTGAELAADPKRNVGEVETVNRLDFFSYNHGQAFENGFSLALNGHLRRRRESTPLNRGRSSVSRSLSNMESRGFAVQLGRELELFGRRAVTTAGAESVRTETDDGSSGSFGTFPFTSGTAAKDELIGLFGQQTFDILEDRLTLTAGLRYDQNKSEFKDKFTPSKSGNTAFNRTSPRVGLNYNPSKRLTGYLSYAEAFRTPTVNEISAVGPFGNNPLRPVKARSAETGLRGEPWRGAEAKASAFWTEVEDEVFFDPTIGAFGQNINIDRTRRTGLEGGLTTRSGLIDAHLNYAYTRATFQSGFTMSGVGTNQRVNAGDTMPLVPEHRVSAGLVLRPAEGWTATLDENCAGSQFATGDEANDRSKIPSYCVTDLGGAYERAGWRFFVKGFNMLDSRHSSRAILAKNPATGLQDRFLVPASGINVSAGLSYRFTAGAASPEAVADARGGDEIAGVKLR